MGDRATCWSITINNPTPQDMNFTMPAGWTMQGQMERGAEGTEHYQGCLKTPQVRFASVKKVFPRAHIEIARNRAALQIYVNKEDTRVATVPEFKSEIPNMFEYQGVIAAAWDDEEFNDFVLDRAERERTATKQTPVDDLAMEWADLLVSRDIMAGKVGVEYIAVNPMWRNVWKRFWRAILTRQRRQAADRQTDGDEEEKSEARDDPPA